MSDGNSAMADVDEGEEDHILNPKAQESIGRSLKAHYDDIVNSPVPDKFMVLLAQLEASEQRKKTTTQEGGGL